MLCIHTGLTIYMVQSRALQILAAHALPVGPMEHTLARRAKDPGTPEKESLVMKRQAMKEAVQKHALLAKSQGKTLRAYLTDLAGNRRRDR